MHSDNGGSINLSGRILCMSETKTPSRLIYAQRIFISDFLKCEKTAEFSEKITKKIERKY